MAKAIVTLVIGDKHRNLWQKLAASRRGNATQLDMDMRLSLLSVRWMIQGCQAQERDLAEAANP